MDGTQINYAKSSNIVGHTQGRVLPVLEGGFFVIVLGRLHVLQ